MSWNCNNDVNIAEEMNSLKTQNQTLLLEQNQNEQKLFDLKNQVFSITQKNDELTQKLQLTEDDLNEEKEKRIQYENNYQRVQETLENEKIKNKTLEIQIQELKDMNPEIAQFQDNKQEFLKIHKQHQKLKEILGQSQLGKEILDQFNRILNPSANNKGENEMVQQVENMQGYDLQILFSCLKMLLNKGAEIKLKFKEDSTQYQDALTRNIHLISFLGLKNAGKSYWHSKLTGQPIMQGQLHATQGLNVNFKEKFWFLDSPGLGETLQNFSHQYELMQEYSQLSREIQEIEKNKNDKNSGDGKKCVFERKKILRLRIEQENKNVLEKQNELYKEKLALEKFIQSFILEHSDVIIYVADILTLEEQKYITQISQKINANKNHQQLIILHNFKTISTISDLQKCIEKDIYRNFSIELQDQIDLNNHAFKDFSQSSSQSKMTHLIMGKEGTEIEEKYNKKSISQISQILDSFQQKGKTQNLFESFQKYTNKNIQDYFNWKQLKYQNDISYSNNYQQLQQQESDISQSQILEKDNKKNQVESPDFKTDMKDGYIKSIPHLTIEKESIQCKDIFTDYLGQRINDFESGSQNCFYTVHSRQGEEKNSEVKTIILSLPAINLVKSIKQRIITDSTNRILSIRIQYDQEKCAQLLESCNTDEQQIDQKCQNLQQQLKFQNVKLDIPICPISYNCERKIEHIKLEKYSVFKIVINVYGDNNDDEEDDFESSN